MVYHFSFLSADSASINRTDSKHTTGEKSSLKSMPSTCEKPWATSLAFLQPSDLMSKTHLQPMVLRPFGKLVSLKTLHQWSASSSSLQAIFHSSCAAFGKRIRSLKCHSRTLETSGIIPLADADETAALSRKFVRPAPPSCTILTR
jgi:hypothetical protein